METKFLVWVSRATGYSPPVMQLYSGYSLAGLAPPYLQREQAECRMVDTRKDAADLARLLLQDPQTCAVQIQECQVQSG